MSEVIYLPQYLDTRNLKPTIRVCSEILSSIESVCIDASKLKFADPFGITTLGSSLNQLNKHGVSCSIKGLSSDVGNYMHRMDCFKDVELLDFAPPFTRNDKRDSLVELRQIQDVKEVSQAAHDLACALVGAFHPIDPDEEPDEMTGYTPSDRLIEPIQYSLSELLENALTHARQKGHTSASVWVAGQYFRGSGMVKISVSDNGCGFLNSLKGHPDLTRETDLNAILTAMKPRVSCNRDLGVMGDSVNQGVGLTTTVRIAEEAGGKAIILSGEAAHDTSGISNHLGGVSWQGVSISLDFSRDKLSEVRYRELLPILDIKTDINIRFE